MRSLAFCFCLLALGGVPATSQQQREDAPIPPGKVMADKKTRLRWELPPPPPGKPIEPAQLRREAEELAELARSVPSEVEQAANGRVPLQLNERLKRIERLAKRLRSQIFP